MRTTFVFLVTSSDPLVPWSQWSPGKQVYSNHNSNIVKLLALALTNLVTKWPNLALANLITNLTKPNLDIDKIWARLDTIFKQN